MDKLKKAFSIKYVFLFPAIIWIAFFVVYPLFYTITVSFFEYRLGEGMTRFVLFGNYLDNFRNPDFWESLRITFIFVAATISVELVLGTFFAWLLSREIRFKGLFRTIFTAPIFTTVVAIGYLGVTMFHQTGGPVNYFLRKEIAWISDPFYALLGIILLDIWRWTPFVFIIMLAGFESIPISFYENAYLDTKSDWRMFRHITLPYLLPTITIVLLFRLIRAFKVFGLAMSLTGGGPGTATQVFSLLGYRTTIKFFDFGHGAAMAIIFLIIVMLIITRLIGTAVRDITE
ncbi:MAG: carbohydrate ABC transporter permease [Spirochaetota bacterium]